MKQKDVPSLASGKPEKYRGSADHLDYPSVILTVTENFSEDKGLGPRHRLLGTSLESTRTTNNTKPLTTRLKKRTRLCPGPSRVVGSYLDQLKRITMDKGGRSMARTAFLSITAGSSKETNVGEASRA